MKSFSKFLIDRSILLFSMVSLIFSTFAFNSSAASYSGKGTKSNPYLVKTGDQLQGISDNLSAHYKLANTIDLSGVDFKPIGSIAQPFTGSFVCDTNDDGTPKYAIKNLKIYNSAGEKNKHTVGSNVGYTDYKENNSKWEAALFGAAKGAKFKNIAILDADITNTVVGQNRMNDDWSLNPGQDEMNASTLIGYGMSIVAENCSATGKINSKSNHNGGLFGRLEDSDVKGCYAKVDISSSGFWCKGGFVGSGKNNKIVFCFSDSNLQVGMYRNGGFAGTQSGTIENCYALGSISVGCAFHQTEESGLNVKNCATKVLAAKPGEVDHNASAENALTLNAACQSDFTVADSGSIDAIISRINAEIAVIKDESKYVPEAVSDFQGEKNNAAGSIEDNSANIVSSAEEKAPMTADEITKLTKELGKKAASKKLTYKDAMKGVFIKEEYSRMTDEEKEKVDSLVVGSFENVYKESASIIVSYITDKVDKFPSNDKINAKNGKEILSIWEDFESLPEEVKGFFQKDTVNKLKRAAETAKNVGNVNVVTTEVDGYIRNLQLGFTVAILIVDALATSVLVVLIVLIIKTLKRIKATGNLSSNGEIQEENGDSFEE